MITSIIDFINYIGVKNMQDNLAIAHSFGCLHRNAKAYIVDACRAWNLTYSEYVLLLRLYEEEGRSQEELAAELDLDKAAITRSIQLLEQKNFLRRETDAKDKRRKHLFVTEYARTQQNELQDILGTWVEYLSEGISKSERDIVVQALTKLAVRSGEADFIGNVRKRIRHEVKRS